MSLFLDLDFQKQKLRHFFKHLWEACEHRMCAKFASHAQTHSGERNIGLKKKWQIRVQVTESGNSCSCGLQCEDADAT